MVLLADGFRSARTLDGVPVRLVATVRWARIQPSLTEHFRIADEPALLFLLRAQLPR
jgi:hypothetical protein